MPDNSVEIIFELVDKVSAAADEIAARTEKALDRITEAFEKVSHAIADEAESQKVAAVQSEKLRQEEEALADAVRRKTTVTQRAGSAVERMGDHMDRAQAKAANLYRGGISVLNSGFSRLRTFLLGAITAMTLFLGVNGLQGMIDKGIEAVEMVDRINFSLRAVTGSQAGASREFEYAYGVADRLGGSIDAVVGRYGKLTAAGKPAGFSIAQVRDIFEATTEAATVFGLSNDDLTGTLRALEQMMSKGNVQAEELRGQLGERLPGAFNLAARAMGMTTAELNKQLELGNVYAVDLLPALARELKRTYGDEVENAADRFSRHVTRMQNRLLFVKEDIARPITEALIPALKDVNDWLDRALTGGKFDQLGSRFGAFVSTVHHEWNAGRLGELISLTIEAGFEAGADTVKGAFGSEFGATMTRTLLKATVGMFGELTQMASDALGFVTLKTTGYIGGSLHFLADNLGVALSKAFDGALTLLESKLNLLISAAETSINALIEIYNKFPGFGDLEKMQLGRVDTGGLQFDKEFKSFDDARNEFEQSIADRAAIREQQIENFAKKVGSLFDEVESGAESASSAIDRLSSLIARFEKTGNSGIRSGSRGRQYGIMGPEGVEHAGGSGAGARELSKQELLAAAKLKGYVPSGEEDGTFVRRNNTLLDASRARVSGRELFTSEDGENFTATGETIGGLDDPAEHFQNAADAIEARLNDIQSQFGTIADQVYNVMGGVFDAMGSSIEGLLNGTMSLNDAWNNFGTTLRNSTARALAEYFQGEIAARTKVFLVKMGLMRAESAAKDAESGKEVARGTAEAASWMPAAIIKSIASFGVALAFGLLAMALIGSIFGGGGSGPSVEPPVGATNPYTGTAGSVQTPQGPGFAQGVVGFRGYGGPTDDLNPVRISNNESIMTADATRNYSAAMLAMNAGASPAQVIAAVAKNSTGASAPRSPSPQPTAGARQQMNFFMLFREEDQRAMVREHGEGMVLDVMQRHGASFGLSA